MSLAEIHSPGEQEASYVVEMHLQWKPLNVITDNVIIWFM